MPPETITASDRSPLEAAIAQAVIQSQAAAAQAATEAALARQQAEQRAIEQFKLPFDEATIAALSTLNFRFENDNCLIAWFEHEGLTVEIHSAEKQDYYTTWIYSAQSQGVEVLRRTENIYPNSSWVGYQTSEQRGQGFLVFLHTASNTPIPEPETRETGTFEDFRAGCKRRERFVRAAMEGTLMGLTSTGVVAGACLQTALFAIETAERVLALMDATPLQRQVLRVLTLEQFTDWLGSKPAGDMVGSLCNEDHPVCRYLKEKCGLELAFSNVSLTDASGASVLGYHGDFPLAHELPLDIAGSWLTAVLNWKTFDPDIETDPPTFTALEVLSFLEPFQRSSQSKAW